MWSTCTLHVGIYILLTVALYETSFMKESGYFFSIISSKYREALLTAQLNKLPRPGP